MVSRSPKWFTFSQLISGCIFTSLMPFFCTQMEMGSSTTFDKSTNSSMARP